MNCMLCQNCGKNQANAHIKKIINGNAKELHLCSECAAALGYGNLVGEFGLNLGDLIGSMFEVNSPRAKALPTEQKCSSCGASFEDFVQTGKAGCSNCYITFYDRLLPSLQRIHGRTGHSGKVPSSAGKDLKIKKELENLKADLNASIEAQEFERAATLRDRIREIERTVQES